MKQYTKDNFKELHLPFNKEDITALLNKANVLIDDLDIRDSCYVYGMLLSQTGQHHLRIMVESDIVASLLILHWDGHND